MTKMHTGHAWSILRDDGSEPRPTTDDEHRAVRAVCAAAKDAEDARLLLDCLGLLEAAGITGEVLVSS